VAFLGDDDELVITTDETGVSWSSTQDEASFALQVSVWWRERLDGTKGQRG
jgi:hypothetical protein